MLVAVGVKELDLSGVDSGEGRGREREGFANAHE